LHRDRSWPYDEIRQGYWPPSDLLLFLQVHEEVDETSPEGLLSFEPVIPEQNTDRGTRLSHQQIVKLLQVEREGLLFLGQRNLSDLLKRAPHRVRKRLLPLGGQFQFEDASQVLESVFDV